MQKTIHISPKSSYHVPVHALLDWAKSEIVLVISAILAMLSIAFVPISPAYISYIDFRTLAILFCLMAIMSGFQRLKVFKQMGEMLISGVSSLKMMTSVMVLMCFFFSMFITNDVALLTFVPFTIVTMHMAEQDRHLGLVIVLETLAANLGSMMLPMGNPQNLYLYSLTDLSLVQFIMLMLPYGLISLIILMALSILMPAKAALSLNHHGDYCRSARQKKLLMLYLLLFILSLLVVARVLDYRIGFAITLAMILMADRKSLLRVDYTLLFTFISLFIFIGNIKQIPQVSFFLGRLVGGHEILSSVLASQVISNVPAAILLSGFTKEISSLIVGTNLGGLGTLIASMASLISFKLFCNTANADKKGYFILFTGLNLTILLILLGASVLL